MSLPIQPKPLTREERERLLRERRTAGPPGSKPAAAAKQQGPPGVLKSELNTKGTAARIAGKRDPIEPANGMKFAVISYVSPLGVRAGKVKAERTYVKIRGAFATEDEARSWCDKLYEVDPDLDMFIVELFEWLQVPLTDAAYARLPKKYEDEKLNAIFEEQHRQSEQSRRELEERLRKAKRDAAKRVAATRQKPTSDSAAPPIQEHDDAYLARLSQEAGERSKNRDAAIEQQRREQASVVAALPEGGAAPVVANGDGAAETPAPCPAPTHTERHECECKGH